MKKNKLNFKKYKLNQLGHLDRGRSRYRPRNHPSLYGGDYPFIQTAEVKAANLYVNEFKNTYNEKGLGQSKLWPKETLCITIAANIAETAILNFPSCFPDSIVGFIANDKLTETKYIKYYIDYIKTNIQNISHGTTQDNLSLKKLLLVDFLIPNDLNEQIKISSILSNYDDLIENNLKRIKLLEIIAQKIYQEWFINFRFPGYKKVILKNTDIGKVPDDWEVKSINKIINIKSGFPFKSKTYTKKGKYGLVTIKNVKDGKFNNKIKDFIDEIPTNMPEYCYINSGDILLSLTGNVGRICLACNGNYLLNQRVAKIKPLEPIDKAFIYFFFRQNKLQKKMELMSTGTAQQNLSPIKLGKLNLLIPSEKIRKSFAEINNPILAQINMLNHQVEKLNEIKNLLLSNLIIGNFDISKIDIKTLDKAL